MTTIAWMNQSNNDLSDAEAQQIVEALNLQAPDLKAAWGVDADNVFASDASQVPAGAYKAYFLKNADVAGALGYHDVDPQGDPYIRVFTETCLQAGGTALSGAESIAVCASHEFCEAAVDPGCQDSATGPDGRVWAKESADPVESDSYTVTLADGTTQVSVSDFVLPAFFEAGSAAPYDKLGKLTSPFSIAPGGYAIINQQQVFGDEYPEWRKVIKRSPVSRTWRRTGGQLVEADAAPAAEPAEEAPAAAVTAAPAPEEEPPGSPSYETHPGWQPPGQD